MLGKTITQSSILSISVKLYSFHDRTVHVRGGIYRGPSLRNLYTNDYYTPLLISATPLNYRGEVVLLLFAVFILHVVLPFFKIMSTGTVFASLS